VSRTVLVVDDDLAIRRLLRSTLERADYRVFDAVDARSALASVQRDPPDAVLLDLGLPDRDGLELVPLIAKQAGIALIVVSAREATEQKVAALDLGAHDYVTKPFDTEELLARMRTALRRSGPEEALATMSIGDLAIDLDQRRIVRGSEEVHLTRKEFDVFALLVRHAGRIVTHETILRAVWGGHDPRIEYLRIVVRNLRQKLEAPSPIGSLIGNEPGVGYRLRA
jgi:two-component system KDP operon response regulator KdpE